MAKQTFTTGQVLLASQLTSLQQTAMNGGAASAKTANYTLVLADAGTAISMTSTSDTTITVNTGIFSDGDTVLIQNLGSGTCTITAGTATVNTAGSLILPQYDAGILKFVSASSAVFYDFIQVGATSPLTTKGDLYGYSTSDARIPIGANNTVLTADSNESLGLKWAAPAGGGGMTLISEQTASSSTGISFTGIAGTYKQLLLVFNGLYHSGVGSQWSVRFNASSSSEYVCLGIKNSGTLQTDTTNVRPPEPFLGEDSTSTTNQNTINGYLLIDNYASSTKFKGFNGVSAYLGTSFFYNQVVGFWENTSAITSVDITRLTGSATLNNITNSTIRLYGIS